MKYGRSRKPLKAWTIITLPWEVLDSIAKVGWSRNAFPDVRWPSPLCAPYVSSIQYAQTRLLFLPYLAKNKQKFNCSSPPCFLIWEWCHCSSSHSHQTLGSHANLITSLSLPIFNPSPCPIDLAYKIAQISPVSPSASTKFIISSQFLYCKSLLSGLCHSLQTPPIYSPCSNQTDFSPKNENLVTLFLTLLDDSPLLLGGKKSARLFQWPLRSWMVIFGTEWVWAIQN